MFCVYWDLHIDCVCIIIDYTYMTASFLVLMSSFVRVIGEWSVVGHVRPFCPLSASLICVALNKAITPVRLTDVTLISVMDRCVLHTVR